MDTDTTKSIIEKREQQTHYQHQRVPTMKVFIRFISSIISVIIIHPFGSVAWMTIPRLGNHDSSINHQMSISTITTMTMPISTIRPFRKVSPSMTKKRRTARQTSISTCTALSSKPNNNHHHQNDEEIVVTQETKTDSTTTIDNDNKIIQTIHDPWDASIFLSTNCWNTRPLVLRQAFHDVQSFVSWDDIIELATLTDPTEGGSITSRLIQHQPNTLDTYTVDFGPFHTDDTNLQEYVKKHDNKYTTTINNNDTDSDTTTAGMDDQPKHHDEDSGTTNVVVASTLVVNDVDRWIPSLCDWIDNKFQFLPRWRRDDAQVSLACIGGGIGPHVDNYDVFLIQATGTREWEIGLTEISVKDEYDNLVDESQVRILDMTKTTSTTTTPTTIKVTLQAGDCLYLPPRILHFGTSTSNDCMTVSIGCRAPSASELVSKLAESISTSTSKLATVRYSETSDDLSSFLLVKNEKTYAYENAKNSKQDQGISMDQKEKMKRMVLDVIEESFEDDSLWDDLVGRLVTTPNRPNAMSSSFDDGGGGDYPTSLSDMDDEWKDELGPIWSNAATTLDGVFFKDIGALHRAEGISFASSCFSSPSSSTNEYYRLYAQGRAFELHTTNDDDDVDMDNMDDSFSSKGFSPSARAKRSLLDRIANGPEPLTRSAMLDMGIILPDMTSMPLYVEEFLLELVEEGLLYGEGQ